MLSEPTDFKVSKITSISSEPGKQFPTLLVSEIKHDKHVQPVKTMILLIDFAHFFHITML